MTSTDTLLHTKGLAFTRQVFATPNMSQVRGLTLLRSHTELVTIAFELPAGSEARRHVVQHLDAVEDELLRRLEAVDAPR